MPILATSQTLNLSPSSLPTQLPTPRTPAAAKASSFPSSFRQSAASSLSISFAGSFPRSSSLTMPLRCRLSRVSCSTVLSGSGGGGGDGLDGGAGGGGGDGGSSGKEAEAILLAGETEEASGLESDVIVLSVEGMTCGGCVASVKRILESRPQVASATVYLEKEIAVVLPVPEAKDTENWQQQLGEKLANHLTASGFKSTFQGQGQEAIDQEAIEQEV